MEDIIQPMKQKHLWQWLWVRVALSSQQIKV
jgi:hypothetical protein